MMYKARDEPLKECAIDKAQKKNSSVKEETTALDEKHSCHQEV